MFSLDFNFKYFLSIYSDVSLFVDRLISVSSIYFSLSLTWWRSTMISKWMCMLWLNFDCIYWFCVSNIMMTRNNRKNDENDSIAQSIWAYQWITYLSLTRIMNNFYRFDWNFDLFFIFFATGRWLLFRLSITASKYNHVDISMNLEGEKRWRSFSSIEFCFSGRKQCFIWLCLCYRWIIAERTIFQFQFWSSVFVAISIFFINEKCFLVLFYSSIKWRIVLFF